jgi:pyrroline-5-carboxylate reductase
MRRIELSIKNRKIGLIGGGHITEIILDNLITSKVVGTENLIISDPDESRRVRLSDMFRVHTTPDNSEAIAWGDVVFMNVRPQVVNQVVDELTRSTFPEGKVIVSVVAGTPMAKYFKLRDELPVVRAVPNPPSQIGQGIINVAFNEYVSDIHKEEILDLFESMGDVMILEEKYIDPASALASPASVLLFFQSLIDAGIGIGMESELSEKIACQTIVGVMEVWNKRQVPLDQLLEETCTPGGVSEEAVLTLAKHGFHAAVCEAIKNSVLKAEQLGSID